jgi:excisionase family DNA binding protein
MNTDNDIIIYTVDDVSHMLKIGKTTTYRLMSSDAFPSFKLNRRLCVTKDNFHTWLHKNTKKIYKF